jgi:aminoglycoside 6'-N-acetyltransferase
MQTVVNHDFSFLNLQEVHFPELLFWLDTDHVKQYWDADIIWDLGKIQEKYQSYTLGYKLDSNNIRKPIHAFMVKFADKNIGYIQYYNLHDFPREIMLGDFTQNTAALDFFIGDFKYLHQGLSSKILSAFLTQKVFKDFRYVLVDPVISNIAAIRSYEKSGFSVIKTINNLHVMLKHREPLRLSNLELLSIETLFRKCFLPDDALWVFGSRTNLTSHGGDLDLYVETKIESLELAVERQNEFLLDLAQAIGEQKIDLVLNVLNKNHSPAIFAIAKDQGIKIV